MHPLTVETSGRGRLRGPRRGRRLAAAALVVVLALAGCADDEADPAEERRERIETRLRTTFSATQSDCILDRLDERTLTALDRDADLPPDGEAMAQFTEATRVCVARREETTTTTAAGPTTPAPPTTQAEPADG